MSTKSAWTGIAVAPLKGRALQVFSLIWLALIVSAVPGLVAGVMEDVSRLSEPTMIEIGVGANTNGTTQGLWVFQVGTDEAVEAGIRKDDTITVMNGEWLAGLSSSEILAILDRTPVGEPVTLEFVSEGGEPQTASLVRDPDNGRRTLGGVFTLQVLRIIQLVIDPIQKALYLTVAILLLRRRHEIVPQIIGFAAAVGSTAQHNWFAEGSLADAIQSFSFPLTASLLLVGLILFPAGRFRAVSSCVLAGLLGLEFIRDWLHGAGFIDFNFALFSPVLLLWLLADAALKYRGIDDDMARQQYRWVFFTAGLAIVFTITNELANSAALYVTQTYPGEQYNAASSVLFLVSILMNSLALMVFPVGLVVSLLRFRLYDADTAIGRTTTYILTTLALGLSFFIVERLVAYIGEAVLGGAVGGISYAIAAALAAVALGPIHNALVGWSDRRFQKPLISLRDDLPETVRDLRHTASFETLLDTVLERIIPAIHAKGAAILDRTGKRVLAARGMNTEALASWVETGPAPVSKKGYALEPDDTFAPFAMPLTTKDKSLDTIGWLLVAPRLDGSLINRDARAVLLSLADPVARAMVISEQRQDETSALTARMDKLSEELASLRETLAQILPPARQT